MEENDETKVCDMRPISRGGSRNLQQRKKKKVYTN